MLKPLESGLRQLLQRAGQERELLMDSGQGMLRIDLKSDNSIELLSKEWPVQGPLRRYHE